MTREILENKMRHYKKQENQSLIAYQEAKKQTKADIRFTWFDHWLDHLHYRQLRRDAQKEFFAYSLKKE